MVSCENLYLAFNSKFDSGNLEKAEVDEIDKNELFARLYTRADGRETSPTKNRTWFHFSIYLKDSRQSTKVTFRFMNLNRVQKLFGQGMRPVYRTVFQTLKTERDDYSINAKWTRIPSIPTTQYVDSHMELTFSFALQAGMIYYFAYCIPYPYVKLQNRLAELVLTKSLQTKIPLSTTLCSSKKIYIHRDVLIYSLDRHGLDILTISSTDFLLSNTESSLEGLYPHKKGTRSKLFDMTKKKFIFISARVHPAETISSFMLDGFLDFITSNTDPKAQLLRSKYVFKIIPMLNPDGVVRGNYRGDANGINLNRVYENPDRSNFPTIWATKQYIQCLQKLGPLEFYFDFHGHANKAGSFLFGNWLPIDQQYEQLRFAKYCMINNPLFDMTECDFAPREMLPNNQASSSALSPEQTKDGTGRVAIFQLTNLTHCYTFEANYYGSKLDRRTLLSSKSISSSSLSGSNSTLSRGPNSAIKCAGDQRFTMNDQLMMGKSIGLAIFDYSFSQHPLSSMKRNDERMHKWVMDRLQKLYMKARMPFPKSPMTFDDRSDPPS